MANTWRNNGNCERLYFLGLQNHCKMVIEVMKLKKKKQKKKTKTLAPWNKRYNKSRQHIKKQRHDFANKILFIQCYSFSSSHVLMWELDHKESWAQKNWCFRTVVLGKTLESALDCKEIKPVHPQGNQNWIFIGRTDAEPEVFGHLMRRTDSL